MKNYRARKMALICCSMLLLGILSLLSPQKVQAAPTILVINVNVTYADSSPVPNGTYDMDFVLYDDPVLGSPDDGIHDKWNSFNKSVEIADGGMVVALGNLKPLPDPALIETYYLDYQIVGDAFLSTRLDIASLSHSYGSGQVDGLSSAQLIQLGQGLQTDTSSTQSSIAVNKTAGGADLLDLRRDNEVVANINTNGDILFKPYTNSASGFVLQNAAALPDTLLRADSLANVIKIGNDTAASTSDTSLLVLDTAPDMFEPTGANGGLYYNSTDNRFMCYENGSWKPCISDLQDAYTNSSTADIVLADAKDFSITAADTATDSNVLINLNCVTCSINGGRFAVQTNGNDVFTINPDGSINRVASAGTSITTELESGSSLQYLATAVPDTDMLRISNSGYAVTSASVNGLFIDYYGGAGAVEASGMRIDYNPGGTSGATWNGLKISSKGPAANGVNDYGLVLEGPSVPGGGNETAIKIASGWDLGMDVGSGGLQLAAQDDPVAPAADNLKIYAKKISGRMLLKAEGPSGVNYPLQPSLFQNQVTMINAQSGTVNSLFGTNRTLTGTASHPAADETFGYMTNYATAASTNSDAGVSNNSTQFFRGSTPGANGYFFNTRVGLPDASYPSTRVVIGMISRTTTQSLGSDDDNGHRSAFTYSTSRGDTNWQFSTKDGSTQNLIDTGLPFLAQKVYDIFVYVPPQGSTIYWRIDNITDNTSAEGSTANNLPDGNQALRGSVGISTLNAVTRNIRMQRMYIEADR